MNHAIQVTPSGNTPACGAPTGDMREGGITCDACLAILNPRVRVSETVRKFGGSVFKITDGDYSLIFSTADEPNPATVVTMRIPDFGVVNFTLSHRESVHLMAHLSDVTG